MSLAVGVWEWEYSGGKFAVQFRPKGKFHSKDYPAHSHYSVKGSTVIVDWDDYGTYEFTLSADGKKLEGSLQGKKSDWRKAVFTRAFNDKELSEIKQHGHSHSHDHGHDDSDD